MFTRCQGCHTVYPVNAALLAQGGGRFRCAKCSKKGNALDALFDSWPEAGQRPPPPGEPPVLGAALTLDPPAAPDAGQEGEEGGKTSARRGKNHLHRIVWVAGALVLAVVITLNLASFFRQPILDHPGLQSLLVSLGIKQPPAEPPFSDLSRIELVSREMKAHPARPGVLVLTATMVNRAERTQSYPDVDITLLDRRNRRVERQLFSPADYLTRSSELRRGMLPNAYLTFSIEMLDPGEQAVGFELQFR